jgi:hypothetical protein
MPAVQAPVDASSRDAKGATISIWFRAPIRFSNTSLSYWMMTPQSPSGSREAKEQSLKSGRGSGVPLGLAPSPPLPWQAAQEAW